MTTEAHTPPQDVDREARDIEHVRTAQLRWCEGFRARRSEIQPTIVTGYTRKGEEKRSADNHASLAHLAEERCPAKLKVPGAAWPEKFAPMPAHDRERWIAGYLDADRIVVAQGFARLTAMDPTRPARRKREKVAEPLEMFPEQVLTKAEVRERRHAATMAGRPWVGA